MAPNKKKSAFWIFLECHPRYKNFKGDMKKLVTELSDTWKELPDDEKHEYKVLARKCNSTQGQKPLKELSDRQNNNQYFLNTEKNLTEMFECIPNIEELLKKKFILLHIHSHTEENEHYFFPAEIAALEFSLKDGIYRAYHQIIGISKNYPRGFAGGMQDFSKKFHQISCFNEHRDDYQQILLEFSTFLKEGIIDHTDLQRANLDLPYLFTIRSEADINIMNTKNSLETLYSTAFPEVDAERYKPIFKIGSTEKLFLEIKKKLNLNLDPQNLTSGKSDHDFLESNYYGWDLGCEYHKSRDISHRCSKSRVIQWMSNICEFVGMNTDLRLKLGRHKPVALENGLELPLTVEDLHLD